MKAVLKNLAIFTTRKHLWWSLFLIKLQILRPTTLLKKDTDFPVNIAKSLRTSFLKIICKRLLLPLEVFYIRNLLILAMTMLNLVDKKTIWLQLIFFFNCNCILVNEISFLNILCTIYRSNAPFCITKKNTNKRQGAF